MHDRLLPLNTYNRSINKYPLIMFKLHSQKRATKNTDRSMLGPPTLRNLELIIGELVLIDLQPLLIRKQP